MSESPGVSIRQLLVYHPRKRLFVHPYLWSNLRGYNDTELPPQQSQLLLEVQDWVTIAAPSLAHGWPWLHRQIPSPDSLSPSAGICLNLGSLDFDRRPHAYLPCVI